MAPCGDQYPDQTLIILALPLLTSSGWYETRELPRPEQRAHVHHAGLEVAAVGAERQVEQLRGLLLGGRWLDIGVIDGARKVDLTWRDGKGRAGFLKQPAQRCDTVGIWGNCTGPLNHQARSHQRIDTQRVGACVVAQRGTHRRRKVLLAQYQKGREDPG